MEPYHASFKALITANEQYGSLLFTQNIIPCSWRGWRPFSVFRGISKSSGLIKKKNEEQKIETEIP
jgi:hypothetical protein